MLLGVDHLFIHSLACKFEIEWGESYREGLKQAARERHVHIERVLANSPKLHVDVIVVVFVYQLEVLNGGLVHTAIEIQHKRLHLYAHNK